MRYAQTGIHGYTPPAGACTGHSYADRPDRGDPHMSVNCGRCEPHLAKDPLWSSSPANVPLNQLEQKAASEATADRERAVLQTAASTAAAVGDITKVLSALVDRLDAMQAPQAAPVAAPVPVVAAPAPAPVPVAPAPVPGTPAPVKPAAKTARSRRSPASTSA